MVDFHSPIKMKGKFSGKTVEWRNGKLRGDDDLVKEILAYADYIERTGNPVFIHDTCLGHRNLLRTNITAYALACMVDEMKIVEGEIPELGDIQTGAKTKDGGPGSGNFSHSGRPGHVGGSGKGGGRSFRVGSKATGYVGMHRSPEFEGIAQHARDNATYVDFVKAMTTGQKEKLKAQYQVVGTEESLQAYTKRVYEMLHGRKAGKAPAAAPHKIVEGKDITATFTRRQDMFPTEIEDVIDAQGFNGKPKVVTKEEFDKIAKEHPEMPLLFRSYAAPDQATLDQYDRQLEGKEGDWYVDCGTGGAAQGFGMYTAGVYDHDSREQIAGAKIEMRHYRRINEDRSKEKLNKMLKENGGLLEYGDMYHAENGLPELFLGPSRNRWYKIGQEGITFTDHKDLKGKLEPHGEYLITYDADSRHELRFTGMIQVDSSGNILSSSGTKMDSSYIDSISNRNPTVYPLEQVDFGPVSTTRRMTLDPSAKIIKTKDLDRLREKINLKNAQDFISSIKDPTPYMEIAEKDYLGRLTSRSVDRGAVDAIYSEIIQQQGYGYRIRSALLRNTGTNTWASSADAKVRSQIAWAIAGEAAYVAYGENSGWRKAPEYKPFFELVDTMPEFKNEVERLRKKAKDYGQKRWKQEIAASAYKYPQIPRLPFDDGVFAAKAGYDAINSEGHGRSGSYTIVLNRTKVILDKDPWEVYS